MKKYLCYIPIVGIYFYLIYDKIKYENESMYSMTNHFLITLGIQLMSIATITHLIIS